ncbi:laccase-4-like [Cucurbita pepo subsp. pepo]|uniref:laccase-4-like n=1 Tax=Cucurbita pepo subsp. pepo TaxID=3664 RepID=UPI000C9D6642|nr:laccase-4-like [Cucurbita pepo subsp. pepo]
MGMRPWATGPGQFRNVIGRVFKSGNSNQVSSRFELVYHQDSNRFLLNLVPFPSVKLYRLAPSKNSDRFNLWGGFAGNFGSRSIRVCANSRDSDSTGGSGEKSEAKPSETQGVNKNTTNSGSSSNPRREKHGKGGGFSMPVQHGKTYLLRIINAALNEELFFKVAGHKLTVVEVDAAYTKPFNTDTIVIAPGQTTNALLTADHGSGKYAISASTFMDTPIVAVDNVTAIATLHYTGTPSTTPTSFTGLPPQNATPVATKFTNSLRSLNSKQYPAKVPLEVDHSLLFTIGLGINPCKTCSSGNQVVADINNVTFVMPTISLLQSHYFNINGVFTDDFPANPPIRYNYTGNQPSNLQTMSGTRLYRLAYNSTVQLVLQDTAMIAPENHPIHLHGFNFFVVGSGLGNFNHKKDPKKFNLVDPVERNTIAVPSGGWVALRFRADNPGVWFMHCHLEVHTTWGLKMAFLVDNGEGPEESLLPPPNDLPKC